MIIGSTTRTIYQRLANHLTGKVDNLAKKAARYILNKGIQQWIILPIEYNTDKKKLYDLEGKWAKIFQNHLINNPIQLQNTKPTRKPTEKKKMRDKQRTAHVKETRYNWRSYIYTIMHTDTWKTWHELPLINLLINIKKAKLPINKEKEITYRIRNHMKKATQYKLRPYYQLKMPTTTINHNNELKSWIRHYIKQHYEDAYSNYVANHIKVSTESITKLEDIIGNAKEILKQYNHDENKATCNCHKYKSLLKDNQTHINIKAQDLPEEWKKLKEILTISKKTPVTLPYKTYLGIAFDRIREFLSKIQLYRKWSKAENENLFKLIFRPKPKRKILQLNYVNKVIKQIREDLGIIPLDKNPNTWCLICKYNYIELHHKEFNNQQFYTHDERNPTEIKKEIMNYFNKKVRPELKHNINVTRKWELSNAYLLPKNKDQNRTRPIVSYYKHYSKSLGEKVARALTIMIKTLTLKWDTCEMHNINTLNLHLQQARNSSKWQQAIQKNSLTFIKFDVKSQFTNLNKDRVKYALNYGMEYLRHLVKRKLCFCIRNRKYEKLYDHLGHPFKYKEIGLTPKLILEYINYELDTAYFQINQICYKQKNGLPMGGFNSAPLACLDAMVQEHLSANILQGIIKTRYRDDILIVIPRKLNSLEIGYKHEQINHIYGPDLSIELEDYSHTNTKFLEYVITNKLETYHLNKNFGIQENKRIIRYPHAEAEYPKHILLGTVIGALKRATSRATNIQLKLYSCLITLLEFMQLQYPYKLLATAINFCNLPIFLVQPLRKYLRSRSL